MPIKYALYPNNLTGRPNDYRAIVQNQNSCSREDLINDMINNGSTVTKADALSVLEDYQATIRRRLEDGDSINDPLFQIRAYFSGVFKGLRDEYDHPRHSLDLKAFPGAYLKEIAENLTVEKVRGSTPRPEPQVLKDLGSDTTNKIITPGGAADLKGRQLKIDIEDPEQGLFLISEGTETRIETLVRNKPSNLIFMIPDTLQSGEYELEVRSLIRNSNDPRTGYLHSILTVQ
jgi:hypothetical protein